ncbi:hypothetical protein WR164_01000 [Philodulcilactobacillus myokoensis]|uniref:SdpI family protein n=1 Tax=Philodulcilactobacillus myokoensis TaxID=2929573 RepID=A0A9W6AZI8_9LACO|nr:hypothetical protein [Philodulcilactobacillus myokoensis]GLB46121.1 hypothetical protein WR164_01000 [Philodulcilactobacillus myokoensis]
MIKLILVVLFLLFMFEYCLLKSIQKHNYKLASSVSHMTIRLPYIQDHHYDKNSKKVFWIAYCYNISCLIFLGLPFGLIVLDSLWLDVYILSMITFTVIFTCFYKELGRYAIKDE